MDAPSRIALVPLKGADGGGWFKQPLIFWTNTTPSAPSKVASQHFLEGAASPPQLSSAEEGNSDSRFASTTYPRTKLEVEGIDAIAIDQEFPKMSKLQTRAKARVREFPRFRT